MVQKGLQLVATLSSLLRLDSATLYALEVEFAAHSVTEGK